MQITSKTQQKEGMLSQVNRCLDKKDALLTQLSVCLQPEQELQTHVASAKAAQRRLRTETHLNIVDLIQYEPATTSVDLSDRIYDIYFLAMQQKKNPIEVAFQQLDLEVAEELFKTGLFEHPGYNFSRTWKQGNLPVWMKPAPVDYLNEWGGVRHFNHNKVDLDVLQLLMKYDPTKLWHHSFHEFMRHAFQQCDLEALDFLLAIYYPGDRPNELTGQDAVLAAGSMGPVRYLVDPFLCGFPVDINNPDHVFSGLQGKYCPNEIGVWMGPSLWDYRPDDNEKVRELKTKIQKRLWWAILAD